MRTEGLVISTLSVLQSEAEVIPHHTSCHPLGTPHIPPGCTNIPPGWRRPHLVLEGGLFPVSAATIEVAGEPFLAIVHLRHACRGGLGIIRLAGVR